MGAPFVTKNVHKMLQNQDLDQMFKLLHLMHLTAYIYFDSINSLKNIERRIYSLVLFIQTVRQMDKDTDNEQDGP